MSSEQRKRQSDSAATAAVSCAKPRFFFTHSHFSTPMTGQPTQHEAFQPSDGSSDGSVFEKVPFEHTDDDLASSYSDENYDPISRAERDQLMAAELYGTVFSEVGEFVESLYPPMPRAVTDAVLRNFYDGRAVKWMNWPQKTTEINLYKWLQNLKNEIQKASDDLSSQAVLHGHLMPRKATTTFMCGCMFYGCSP